MKKITISSPKTETKIIAKPLPSLGLMVAKVKEQPKVDITSNAEEENILLATTEGAFSGSNQSNQLEEKLAHIEELMSQENIPIKALKYGCDDIMKDIKHNPETLLELEPETIELIVRGYIKATDEETRKILTKKAKTKKKPAKKKVSSKAQAALELAKQMELDDVDF